MKPTKLKLAAIAVALALVAACHEPARAETLPCVATINQGSQVAYNGDALKRPSFDFVIGGRMQPGVAYWDTAGNTTQNLAGQAVPVVMRFATYFECDATTLSPGTPLGRGTLTLTNKGFNNSSGPVSGNSVAVRFVESTNASEVGQLVGSTNGWPRQAPSSPIVVNVDFGGTETASGDVLLRLESAIQTAPNSPSGKVWDVTLLAGAVLEVEVAEAAPDDDLTALAAMTGLPIETLQAIIAFLEMRR